MERKRDCMRVHVSTVKGKDKQELIELMSCHYENLSRATKGKVTLD